MIKVQLFRRQRRNLWILWTIRELSWNWKKPSKICKKEAQLESWKRTFQKKPSRRLNTRSTGSGKKKKKERGLGWKKSRFETTILKAAVRSIKLIPQRIWQRWEHGQHRQTSWRCCEYQNLNKIERVNSRRVSDLERWSQRGNTLRMDRIQRNLKGTLWWKHSRKINLRKKYPALKLWTRRFSSLEHRLMKVVSWTKQSQKLDQDSACLQEYRWKRWVGLSH